MIRNTNILEFLYRNRPTSFVNGALILYAAGYDLHTSMIVATKLHYPQIEIPSSIKYFTLFECLDKTNPITIKICPDVLYLYDSIKDEILLGIDFKNVTLHLNKVFMDTYFGLMIGRTFFDLETELINTLYSLGIDLHGFDIDFNASLPRLSSGPMYYGMNTYGSFYKDIQWKDAPIYNKY